MIANVVTDHDVFHEVGVYLVAIISSKSGCYWRGGSKKKKITEEKKKKIKMGRKTDEKNQQQQPVRMTNNIYSTNSI